MTRVTKATILAAADAMADACESPVSFSPGGSKYCRVCGGLEQAGRIPHARDCPVGAYRKAVEK